MTCRTQTSMDLEREDGAWLACWSITEASEENQNSVVVCTDFANPLDEYDYVLIAHSEINLFNDKIGKSIFSFLTTQV